MGSFYEKAEETEIYNAEVSINSDGEIPLKEAD